MAEESIFEQILKEKKTEPNVQQENTQVNPVGTETQVQKTAVELQAEQAEQERQKQENEKFEQKWSERFKEKFGEDYSDEVVTKYKTPKIEVQKATYHELAETVSKFIENKENPKEALKQFLETQLTDYDTLTDKDPLTVVKQKMKLEYPSMSDKQITAIVNKKYDVGNWSEEGGVETEEEILSKAMLKMDALADAKILKEKQIQLAKQNNEPSAADLQKVKDANDALQNGIRNSLKDYKKETFVLDKDTSIEYDKIDAANLEKEIFEKASSPTQYAINRYTDGKGNIDYEKLRKETIILNNFDEILKTAETRGIEKGKKIGLTEGEIVAIKEFKNTNFEASKKGTVVTELKPSQKAVMEAARAQGIVIK